MEKFIHNAPGLAPGLAPCVAPDVITDFESAIADIDIDDPDDSEELVSIEIRPSATHPITQTSEYLYDETREKIKSQLNKTIEFDIKDTITWRFLWRKSGNIAEGLSLLASLSATVLSFSSGAFNNTTLAFVAGCLGSISLALMRASSYALKESIEREEQLNILLEKAHITQVPSLITLGGVD